MNSFSRRAPDKHRIGNLLHLGVAREAYFVIFREALSHPLPCKLLTVDILAAG